MAATRASGTNAVRYGTMRDNVLRSRSCLPDGRITHGRRARKSSAGYDLTRLFVGSEGTLGVITEVTLKLYGIPEAIAAAVCPFPSVKAACNATILAIQTGIPVARIELADETQVQAINLYSKLGLPERRCCSWNSMARGQRRGTGGPLRRDRARPRRGGPFEWATRAEDRTRLWQARHDAYWAGGRFGRASKTLATDVCVPMSRLAECVDATQRDIAETGLHRAHRRPCRGRQFPCARS